MIPFFIASCASGGKSARTWPAVKMRSSTTNNRPAQWNGFSFMALIFPYSWHFPLF
jgi:hypothetical protein